MNKVSKSSLPSGGWVRIAWIPDSGIVLVSGDSAGILGVSARRLINAPDPLNLLPAELSGILSSGLPEVPVQISTSSFTGTVCTENDHAEILLFDTPDLQDGGNIMLDELGAGVVVTDRTGIVVLWNKAMTSIFRIPKQHVMGKQLQDVLTSPILYSWDNVIKMVLDGKQIRVECHLDGQRRVDCTFSPGGPGVIGTCFETTESFQAENRLRTSRKMNQAYFHSVSTGLVLFDKDYRILVANRAFGRMFGLVENLLGIHLNEILPRESFAIVEDQTRTLFSGSGNKENEMARIVRFVLPDETRRVISQNIKPIVEESGAVFYAVGIFEDVSEKSILFNKYNAYQNKIKEINTLESIFFSDQSDNLDRITEVLRDCFSAKAVAVYISDPLGDIELAGKTAKWPENAPESFSDLRLASFMIESHSKYQLNGDEIGVLNSWFGNCLIFPIESDEKNYGYVIAADVDNTAGSEVFSLAETSTHMLALLLSSVDKTAEIEHLDLLLIRQSKLAGSIITALDIPVAVFRVDWSVILWNDSMEALTGVSFDLATSRTELAASVLFDDIGGITAIQRITRNGSSEYPESWEVANQNGIKTRCAWRLSRAESVEGGKLEPIVIVSGIKSDEIYSIQAAKNAADMYTALSRGTSALLSASDRTKVVEAAATAFLEISGASRITLSIRGINPITRTSYDPKSDEIAPRQWKLAIETDTDSIGECVFHGGKEYSALNDFARNVARTCGELEKTAVGRRFAFLAEKAAGKFLITNSSGRILLSTWIQVTDGIISNRSIYDVFSGSDWVYLDSMMLGILRIGRLNMLLKTERGEELQVAAVALNGLDAEPIIIWWPVYEPSYISQLEYLDKSENAACALLDVLDDLSTSIGRGFIRIKEVMNPDHPVAAVLNTAKYAFEGLTKDYVYLRLLQTVWNYVPEQIDPELFLDKIKSAFLENGLLPPNISISGELYDICGNIDILKKVTTQLCYVVCPSSNPVFNVSLVNRKEIREPVDLNKGTEQFVRINMRCSDGRVLSGISDDFSDISTPFDFSSGLNPASEVSLLSLILRLSGGALKPDDGFSSLTILLPCWK